MEVTVKIPEGEYCDGCKFLNRYTHNLVNLFGDPTGNVREGYECKYHNTTLQYEDCGCYHRVRKCFMCGGKPEDKFAWLAVAMCLFGKDAIEAAAKELKAKEKENAEAK